MARRDSEEARIVKYTMELIESEPTLNELLLRKYLIENTKTMKFTKPFQTMAIKSIEHYLYMARLFVRLKDLLTEEVQGTEEWTEDNYQQILSTGILLCNKAGKIYRLSNENFLFVLKKAVSMLPASKKEIESYIESIISKIDTEEMEIEIHDEHNNVRDIVATKYLRDIGCQFISTEVELEKRDNTSRGLKIDALGWKSDGTICGIEVKTRVFDDVNTKKAIRLDRYIRYCNEFYILTTDNKIYENAIEWRKNRRYNEMGIILCNRDTLQIEKIEKPREIKREVTEAMLLQVQKAFLIKFSKLVNTVCLDETEDTPALVLNKIKSILSKEFIHFGASK